MTTSIATIPTVHDTDLAPAEITTLRECEEIIDRGRKSFIDVGKALATIRDSKLYRQTHDTFEAYCKDRWQIGRSYANKQIAAAVLVRDLGTTVPILPTSESHVRALLQFDEADRPKVWQAVVNLLPGQAVTADKISQAVSWHIRKSQEQPFKKLRLAKKRQLRERREECVEGPTETFNLAQEVEDTKNAIKRWSDWWPAEHLPKLVELLRQMADDLANGPSVTCPNCGSHEADEDGDCAKCHEPGIVRTEANGDHQP